MREIQLTKGKTAKVSDEDFERVNAFKWYASNESCGKKWYAIRWVTISPYTRKKMRMAHLVMGIPPGALAKGFAVDHIDGDSLNNQRSNLEIVTHNENMYRVDTWSKKKVECVL